MTIAKINVLTKMDNMSPSTCYLCQSPEGKLESEILKKPEVENDLGIPPDKYRRAVYRCSVCSVYYNIHDYVSEDFYSGKYNKLVYDHQMLERYTKIMNLPVEKSDNKQRVRRVADMCKDRDMSPDSVHVLDVGSGSGVFLGEMKQLGFTCSCVDPDKGAVEHALRHIPVDHGYVSRFDTFKPTQDRYDIITFNKVLEHVKQPALFLSKAVSLLTYRGFIYIELPDGDNAIRHGSVGTRQEFVLEHFTVFNRKSLLYLAQQAGLKPLKIESIHEPSDKFTIYGFFVKGHETSA